MSRSRTRLGLEQMLDAPTQRQRLTRPNPSAASRRKLLDSETDQHPEGASHTSQQKDLIRGGRAGVPNAALRPAKARVLTAIWGKVEWKPMGLEGDNHGLLEMFPQSNPLKVLTALMFHHLCQSCFVKWWLCLRDLISVRIWSKAIERMSWLFHGKWMKMIGN